MGSGAGKRWGLGLRFHGRRGLLDLGDKDRRPGRSSGDGSLSHYHNPRPGFSPWDWGKVWEVNVPHPDRSTGARGYSEEDIHTGSQRCEYVRIHPFQQILHPSNWYWVLLTNP